MGRKRTINRTVSQYIGVLILGAIVGTVMAIEGSVTAIATANAHVAIYATSIPATYEAARLDVVAVMEPSNWWDDFELALPNLELRPEDPNLMNSPVIELSNGMEMVGTNVAE